MQCYVGAIPNLTVKSVNSVRCLNTTIEALTITSVDLPAIPIVARLPNHGAIVHCANGVVTDISIKPLYKASVYLKYIGQVHGK